MGFLLWEELTFKIIGAAKEVYRELGPGFLESVYEDALCYEFERFGLLYQRQVNLDVRYKETVFDRKFCADLLVDGKVLVENKASRRLTPQDEAQVINYLKVTRLRVGLLFNFGGTSFEMVRRIF